MKKIFIVAGLVLFISLMLTTWLFVIDFSDFAKNLGKKTEDVGLDEKSKFIGTWKTTYIEGDYRFVGYNGIYKFHLGGTGTIGGLICTWDISNNKLVIIYNEGTETLIYDYFFYENYDKLSLNNSYGTLDFSKFLD